jgi:uncharacterized delta-60 repeat protein
MVRYHASGRLDRAFRKVVLRGFGAGNLDTLGAGVDGAGRIVVAACAPPDGWGAFVLGRLLRRGTLDASFGRGGTARIAVPGRALAPRALAVARGTIAVAGEASAGASRALFIARYGPDGRPDERFGGRGVLVDDALGGAGAVALDDRGRIVVAGDGYVARFDARGARDRTFGNGGLTGVAELLAPRALLLDSRRRIVVGGSAHPRQRPRLAVVRLLASGRSDRHFGTGGTALDRRPGDHWSRIEALLPLADGLLAVGWATRGGAVQTRRYRIVAIRLDDRGRLRRTYGDRGRVTVARFEAQARAAFRAGRAALVVGPDDDLRPRAIRFARLPLR